MFNKKKQSKDESKYNMLEDKELAINSLLGDQVEDIEEDTNYNDSDNFDEDVDGGVLGDILKEKSNLNEKFKTKNNSSEKTDNVKPVKIKKEKKSLFKKSSKKTKAETEEENLSDSVDVTDDGIEIFGLEHIEKLTVNAREKKNPKKILFPILIGIFVMLIIGLVAFVLLTKFKDVIVTPPVANVVETVEPTIDPTNDSVNEMTQCGKVKRIMSNKVIIRADNSLSDTIYFIDDITDIDNVKSLEIDDNIEYKYMIRDAKNIILSSKAVYRGTIMSVDANKVYVQEETKAGPSIKEYGFSDVLADTFKQITIDNIIEYTRNDSMILSITNIIKLQDNNVIEKPVFKEDNAVVVKTENFNPAEWQEELNAISTSTANPDFALKKESDFENNSVKFYNSFTDPVWIRFAWRINEYSPTVPSVEQVGVKLITPSGNIISSDNISDYGRMWVDGNIINFALKTPEVGEWMLKADRNIGFYLGETQFMLMKLTGYITVNKFGINNLGDGQLDFIWNIGGVEDINYSIKVDIKSEKYSTTLFTANSKTQDLKLIDHSVINAKSIPKGTYDIIVTVKDIDIYTEKDNEAVEKNVRQVGAETIIHEYNAGKLTIGG